MSYVSERIEQFATNMLLSAVDSHTSDSEHLQPESAEQRTEGNVGFQSSLVCSCLLHIAIESLISDSTKNTENVRVQYFFL